MNIKIRPAILVIATGLVVALVMAIRLDAATEIITGIVVAIAGIASKLVESEEKGV